MKWFKDMKIGSKLQCGFAAAAAIAGLIGWVGYSGMNDLRKGSASIYYDGLVPIRDLGYANAAFLIARTEIRSAFVTKDRAKRKEYFATVAAEAKNVDGYIEAYRKSVLSPAERDILPKFIKALTEYRAIRARIIDLLLAGQG